MAVIILYIMMAMMAFLPVAFYPEVPDIPQINEQVNFEEIGTIKKQLDLYKADQIEQFIVSVCDLRKAAGEADIFPSNTNLTNLQYSDTTYNLGASLSLTMGGITKSDGTRFTIENLSGETECDVSDFVR